MTVQCGNQGIISKKFLNVYKRTSVINEIMEWSRKWRININADKTEYCIFSSLKQPPGHAILKLNYTTLKYDRNPKLLGVTLDEKLNFGQHILNIERKAGNSLGILRLVREIKGLGQIKTIFLLQIYNSLIGSVLQYASCVWQIGNKDKLDKLNTVQRKVLFCILRVIDTGLSLL